jgi:AraC-like DNA-binding protein
MDYKFTTILPSKSLSAVVKNFFIIEFDNNTSSTDYLLPDGLPSFFYIQTDEPFKTHFRNKGQTINLHEGFYVGFSNTAVEITYKKSKIAGASVFPAYFNMVFGKSPLEILNQFCRLDETELYTTVKSLPSILEGSCGSLFDLFEKHILHQLSDHPINNDLFQVYKRITNADNYGLRVDELAASLGYSPRYLHYRFSDVFGMPPKQFIKLVKINHALKYIYDRDGERNLSSIAHEVNYHDQSHFIREFKSICGKTPKEVLGDPDSLANKFRLF